jgi:hypothetical protein
MLCPCLSLISSILNLQNETAYALVCWDLERYPVVLIYLNPGLDYDII